MKAVWIICCVILILSLSMFLHKQWNSARSEKAPESAYVAFSLREAETRLRRQQNCQGVTTLFGITELEAVVREGNDLIIIGKVEPHCPSLEMADLVSGMRAVLGKHQWPLVSIDRTPETARTGMQHIRLEGVERASGFAAKLVAADVALKKAALGLIATESWGVKSYLALSVAQANHDGYLNNISSRFWFYPMHPALAVRNDICVLAHLDVGVVTQVLAVNGKPVTDMRIHDPEGDKFAAILSERMAQCSHQSLEIGRLKGLMEMVAICRGIQLLTNRPPVDYWLHHYPVPEVPRLVYYPMLKNAAELTLGQQRTQVQLDGGCELKALAVRLRDGDVSAFHDIVVRSRPAANTLSWSVPLGNWQQPDTSAATIIPDDDCQSGKDAACMIDRHMQGSGTAPLPLLTLPPSKPTVFPSIETMDHLPRGGVKVNVTPQLDGKGGAMVRDAVLDARPSGSATKWEVPLPSGGNQ